MSAFILLTAAVPRVSALVDDAGEPQARSQTPFWTRSPVLNAARRCQVSRLQNNASVGPPDFGTRAAFSAIFVLLAVVSPLVLPVLPCPSPGFPAFSAAQPQPPVLKCPGLDACNTWRAAGFGWGGPKKRWPRHLERCQRSQSVNSTEWSIYWPARFVLAVSEWHTQWCGTACWGCQ